MGHSPYHSVLHQGYHFPGLHVDGVHLAIPLVTHKHHVCKVCSGESILPSPSRLGDAKRRPVLKWINLACEEGAILLLYKMTHYSVRSTLIIQLNQFSNIQLIPLIQTL